MLRGISTLRALFVKNSYQWQQCMSISSTKKLLASATPEPIIDPPVLYTGVNRSFSLNSIFKHFFLFH